MSADNGVYILKTKDQYRVIHAQAIENLQWTYLNNGSMLREFVPTRLIEYYGKTRYTRDLEKAMTVANGIARGCRILEYGIQILQVNKTWKQIVKEANELAPKEIDALETRGGHRKYDLEEMKRVFPFLDECNNQKKLNRKQNLISAVKELSKIDEYAEMFDVINEARR